MSRTHPSCGKWISDGVHEPYQKKRKYDTYGEPFVPKRAPIPAWLSREHEQRLGARETSSVYSRPTAKNTPSPTVSSTDSELEEVGYQIGRLQARNAVSTPEPRPLSTVSEEGGYRVFTPQTQALLDGIFGYHYVEKRSIS